ncbi:MAG: zf-HC2 domain-containing protein, partial [Nitrospirae bacterium]|nr:zf-HC2 domain-containing protein [Nitrospirota bacterium]MBI3594436.1 zf-HC2 domain-containing protein [Nitrospirota bacterium]
MNCQEVKDKLSYYLDSVFPDDEKTAIRQHLASCTVCREELETLLKVIGAVKNLRKVDVPAGFSGRVMARVKEEEKKKIRFEKSLSFFGFREMAYGLVVLLFGGILYAIFHLEKNRPVQLSQLAPAVVQEATKAPVRLSKDKMNQSAPETDLVAPVPSPQVSVKTPKAAMPLSEKSAPAVELDKSEPMQSLNRPSLRAKSKEALLSKLDENSVKSEKESDTAKEETLQVKSLADAPTLPALPSPSSSAGGAPLTTGLAASNKITGLEIMKKKSEAYMANDQMSTVTLHLFTKEGDEKQIKTKRYWKNFAGKDGM